MTPAENRLVMKKLMKTAYTAFIDGRQSAHGPNKLYPNRSWKIFYKEYLIEISKILECD